MDYGFDNIFGEGPTPTTSALVVRPEMGELGELTDSQFLDLQDDVDGRISSLSNVDGMNV